jgi:DNA-binding response OmpR family regulator
VTDVNFQDVRPGPKYTGITAIGEIRRRWANVPVIFYSAYLSDAMRMLIKELGNATPVEKLSSPFAAGPPTDPVGVIERVDSALRWSALRKKSEYEGRDRRERNAPAGPHRRSTDCEEITISPSLETALQEARNIQELHAIATQGGPKEQA